jgi:hypothetical protein
MDLNWEIVRALLAHRGQKERAIVPQCIHSLVELKLEGTGTARVTS